MGVRLPGLFMSFGLVVSAILFSFHLYLRERGEVRQAGREVGRWEQLKTGDWGAPAISRLTTSEFGDVSLRRLASLERRRHDSSRRSQVMELDDRVREEEGDDHSTPKRNRTEDDFQDRVKNSSASEKDSLNLTEGTNLTGRFSVRRPFSLPTPGETLPLPQLLRCQWVDDLRTYLTSLPPTSRLISIVSSDYKYREVLLNWLILAEAQQKQPLTNILVLSLDKSLHQLLTDRGIPCVFIPISCLVRPRLSLTMHVAFTQVHIMRLLVMRLLNHWRYDVANYDSDALVLRNPETRYKELGDRHFIGSVGHFPHEMDRKWGTAVCIGVVLIRSCPQTGEPAPTRCLEHLSLFKCPKYQSIMATLFWHFSSNFLWFGMLGAHS